MNSDGHQGAARIVNSLIGGVFDEGLLLAGAIDPDVHESGRSYTGIEAKHHFDSYGVLGHPHTAENICTIVLRYLILARSFWRNGSVREASFFFGVATHFYLDGFICSPSVDEDAHSRGDREFTRTVLKIEKPESSIVKVSNRQAGCSQYALELTAFLRDHFGQTDPSILPQALGILAEMGRIVADDVSYSPEFQNQIVGCSNRCIEFAEQTKQKFQDKQNAGYIEFVKKRKSLLENGGNVFYYVNDILLNRRHQQSLRFWTFFRQRHLAAVPYYELNQEPKNVRRESVSAVSSIRRTLRDCSAEMSARVHRNDWYSPAAMQSCADRFYHFSNSACEHICKDINSFECQKIHDYQTAVRNQDNETVGNFLRQRELDLWESPAEREKAKSLAGDQVNRFLPWIITLPIGFVGSLLCLLIGFTWCLLVLVITLLSGMLLTFLMRKRLDLAYKWDALERLKKEIQCGQAHRQEKTVSKTDVSS